MACRDCKRCTNSMFANAGRKSGRLLAFVTTAGLSEAAMATQKKCRACGHQMSLHGVDQVGDAPQPTVQVQGPVQVQPAPAQASAATPPPPSLAQAAPAVPPGWYYPEGPEKPARWWDGNA